MRELAARKFSDPELAKIKFFTPEEFFSFLEELNAQSASTEKTIKGWKVKTSFRSLEEQEKEAKKHSIAQKIWRAVKKLGGE